MQIVIGIFIAVVAAVCSTYAFEWWQARQNNVQWLVSKEPCQFGFETCQGSNNDVTISVDSSSEHLTAKEPFDITVTIEDLALDQVWLELEGINMYMGISRYRLQPLGDGKFGMTLRLPTCAVDEMNWKASILAEHREKITGYQFEFVADTIK
jgi:hypothetical protein